MKDKIFISYSHRDTDTVDNIVQTIAKETELDVWYDKSLRGGEQYFSTIANQILGSKFFVFMVSDNSVQSDWCIRELEFAASEKKVIIAVWLEEITAPPRVRLVIQNTNYINYYSASSDSFSNSVSRAFLEDSFVQSANHGFEDGIDGFISEETYFIDREKRNKIRDLVSKEKQSKYSVCFEGENAYLLGLAYELGIDVEEDSVRARFYYKISAYKGSAEGKYLYAAIRMKQENADKAELLKEMNEAAEQGSVFALTYLGDDYYNGRNGCEKNIEKAYDFWKRAADLGSAEAMYHMSYGYMLGEYVKKDAELSYMYALMATEYEFPRAYRIIGYMYHYGFIYVENYAQAVKMYEKAIRCGDYISLCYEGCVYGEMEDYTRQLELCEKAASLAQENKIKSGYPFYLMGYIYQYGKGVNKDIVKAVEYYLWVQKENMIYH